MRGVHWTLVALVAAILALSWPGRVEGKDTYEYSPPVKAGRSTVQIAYRQTGQEWIAIQQHYLIDGRKVNLPPVSLGYDRVFSAPRWVVEGGRIAGLKYWQFDKQASKRRMVWLTFPGYRVVKRGGWAFAPGGDTVPDPPR